MNKKTTLSCIRLFFLLALSCFTWNNSNAQCTPFFSGDCVFQSNYIDSIVFANINAGIQVNSCDVPNPVTTAAKMCVGSTDTLFLFVGDTADGVGVFIDTNGNGTFESTEFFYGAYISATPYYAIPIIIPATARAGTFNMRVLSAADYAFTAADACILSPGGGNYYDLQLTIIDTLHIAVQPAPIAGCIGGPVTFSVVDSGNGLNYQWFKDSTLIMGATNATYTINHFQASDTDYYYVRSANMCSMAVSDSVMLTIKAPPPVHISAGGPISFCPGGKVGLMGNNIAGDKYQWLLNGVPTGDTTIYDTVAADGNYTFVISNGCTDTSSAITVHNYPTSIPPVSPAGLTKICAVQLVPQQYTTPIGTGVTFQWQVNTGIPNVYVPISNDTLNYITATQTGLYRVVLTDSNHCVTMSVPSTLQVNMPPTVNISTLAAPYLCAGGYITLMASSSDTGEKFRWVYNDTAITPANTASGATYNAFHPGSYTVTGTNGCSVTDSIPIILQGVPSPSVITAGPAAFCGGGSVLLSSGITDTNSNITYQWQKNGVDIAGATATTYTAMDSGNYSVVIIINNTCTAASTPTHVTIYPTPAPAIIIGADGLTLTVSPFFHSYQWYLNGNAISAPAGTLGSYVADSPGNYSVFVKDDNGCTATSTQIYGHGILAVGTVPNPQSISVYPNPATSVVHINAPFTVNVSVATIDGREVLSQNAAKDVNIQSLANGIYMLRITDENGNTLKVEKLVKANQ